MFDKIKGFFRWIADVFKRSHLTSWGFISWPMALIAVGVTVGWAFGVGSGTFLLVDGVLVPATIGAADVVVCWFNWLWMSVLFWGVDQLNQRAAERAGDAVYDAFEKLERAGALREAEVVSVT